ncbi:MAG TPA: hypothetical protein VHZ24_20025 [Pirellulales bacterium]|nr:hypothetical protein [Pirellulales bacterium]
MAVVVLMAGRSSAVFYELQPSKDEWGLKYDVELNAAAGDTLNVVFTLAHEGRLKPIYSITVVAFSKQTDSQGGRSYDVKAPIELKTTADGKRAGQVQIRKEFLDRAKIRILTLTVDGRPQTAGAAYCDIPLKKFLQKNPATVSREAPRSNAAPPASKVTK